jgi:hypothetical protein
MDFYFEIGNSLFDIQYSSNSYLTLYYIEYIFYPKPTVEQEKTGKICSEYHSLVTQNTRKIYPVRYINNISLGIPVPKGCPLLTTISGSEFDLYRAKKIRSHRIDF